MEFEGRSAVTVLEVAEYRLGRPARNGADYAEAGFAIMGGCERCGASIAAYNAYPSKSGFWRCGDCLGDLGYRSVAEAIAELFGGRGLADGRAFMEQVAAEVRKGGGVGECEAEHMGGGIWCVVVRPADGSVEVWGTANEYWGADRWATAAEFEAQDDPSGWEVGVLSSSQDAAAIGRAIAEYPRGEVLR